MVNIKNIKFIVLFMMAPVIMLAQPKEVINAYNLNKAIESQDIEKVNKILKTGINVNVQYNGRNALHAACKTGSAEMVQKVIDSGADVNSITDEGQGLTSLQWVCWGFGFKKSIEVIEILLKNGADPNIAQNNYKYPLFYAINNKDLTVAKLLLTNGAKKDVKNSSGQTPADYISAKLSEKSLDSESRKVFEQILKLLNN